ncbi:hypothetical protein PENTCL1PPCAC_54 [Pristionchus entomophagus]|uniref:Uncharacterized protein n=1 Tax=Pristionchus entomophagus TaxID=358040 RepID=A0AAV5S9Z4_9BILA|nr:hypothetical protein PENTCL1PPCAC_54 [Pristionchus entomophagus]
MSSKLLYGKIHATFFSKYIPDPFGTKGRMFLYHLLTRKRFFLTNAIIFTFLIGRYLEEYLCRWSLVNKMHCSSDRRGWFPE